MKHLKIILLLLLVSFMLNGFWSGKSDKEIIQDTKKEIQERLQTNNKTLRDLYKYSPEAKKILLRSYGYASFTNFGVNLIFISAETGKGLAHNNKTGLTTYMNMASGGVGLGLGAKDFRIIFLFKNKKVYENFINNGWEANASAKYKEEGKAYNAAITIAPGIRMYKLTKNGLSLQATIHGTKYWKDGDLN
ncbi:MAG: hypothetical protein COB17_08625 [Sulfurimonas sp.]|nr:MAG: hypothetical protein COB17_08625 [Sulfurimonas sp.]